MVEAAVAEVTIIPVSKGASKQIEDQLDGEKAGQKVGSQVGDGLLDFLGKTLKVGAAAAGGLAIAGIGTVIAKGFQRLDALDQATAKLTGLGHSAKGVQQIMDNALASVKGTAFGMGEAATVAASMVAAGIKPGAELQKTLSLVGDAATIAHVGMTDMGRVFVKVAASNKAQMDIFNQLADMGVPALALVAQQLGVTQEQASNMASAGKIDFATFQAAMESGLGGAALSSGATFQGSLDNMGAAAGRLGEKLLSGFFPALTGGFGDLTGWLDTLGPKALEMGAAFGSFAAEALPKIISGLKTFGEIILNVINWIGQNIDLIQGLGVAAGIAVATILGFRAVVAVMQGYVAVMAIVKAAQLAFTAATFGSVGASYAGTAATNAQKVAMLAAAGAGRIYAAAQELTKSAAWKATAAFVANTAAQVGGRAAALAGSAAMGIATAAQWAWNAALSANPIGIIVLAIAALVAGLVWFFTQTELGQEIWSNFTQFLGEAWANIAGFFTDAYEGVIKPILDGIGAVFTWLYENIILPVVKGIIIYISIWAALFIWLWKTVISPVVGFIGAIFTWVYETVIKPVVAGIATIITWVAGIISTVLQGIAFVWQTVWSGVSSFFGTIWAWIVSVATAYVKLLLSIITTVIGFVSDVWTTVWGGISNFFGTVWSGIVSAVTGYVNMVRSVIVPVITTVAGIWASIWSGVSSFFIGAWNNIMGVVNTIGNAFGAAFAGVAGIVAGAFDGVVSIVKGIINAIIDAVNGAISGINDVASSIGGALGFDVRLGKIPRLAGGGIVSARPGGIVANIGEGRYDEAVIPLSPKVLEALSGSDGSGAPTVLNQYITTVQDDPRIQARQWGRQMQMGLASR